MITKCLIGNVGPRIDSGEESEFAPTADSDTASTRRFDHSAVSREVVRAQLRRVVDLATLGFESRILEVAMIVGGISTEQKRWEATVVVDRIRIIQKRRKPASHRTHLTIAQPRGGSLEEYRRRFVLIGERLEMN